MCSSDLVFSVVTMLELATPFVTTPLFTLVFNVTLVALPGAVFLLCAGALAIIIVNFVYVHFAMRNIETEMLLSSEEES